MKVLNIIKPRLLLALCFVIPSLGRAGYFVQFEGETRIILEVVPIRESFPDGRIVGVAKLGDIISVLGASGDSRGQWLKVEFKENGRVLSGYIDDRFTSFDEDFKTGKIKQPSLDGKVIKRK